MASPKVTWKPHTVRGKLTTSTRDDLPDSAFAFPHERKEPLVDAQHVRNALARFGSVRFESEEARDRARQLGRASCRERVFRVV